MINRESYPGYNQPWSREECQANGLGPAHPNHPNHSLYFAPDGVMWRFVEAACRSGFAQVPDGADDGLSETSLV